MVWYSHLPCSSNIRCDCVKIVLPNGNLPIVPDSSESSMAVRHRSTYNIACIPGFQSFNIRNLLQTKHTILCDCAVLQNSAIYALQYWEIIEQDISNFDENGSTVELWNSSAFVCSYCPVWNAHSFPKTQMRVNNVEVVLLKRENSNALLSKGIFQ